MHDMKTIWLLNGSDLCCSDHINCKQMAIILIANVYFETKPNALKHNSEVKFPVDMGNFGRRRGGTGDFWPIDQHRQFRVPERLQFRLLALYFQL